VVVAGCGFLGEAAAGFFWESGWQVLGLTASPESAARRRGRPYRVIAADIRGDLRGVPGRWHRPDVLIHCASSGRGGVDAYRAVYRDGLANLVGRLRAGRTIFTGSTSVYGQADGSWVDESSPTVPGRETGAVLLEAERIALEAGGVVARLAGLYGPGRSALLDRCRSGTAVIEDGGGRWINQIHRDDAARALVLLADGGVVPGIYNVSDGTPATQREVYGWLAAALAIPLPPDGPASARRKRGDSNKRVSNAKLVAAGWCPVFPSYAQALPGLIAGR
jgi:nucleoside-diphosphate-sugar epimerase